MNILIVLFALAGLACFMAMGRYLSVGVGAVLVVLVGAVFGHAFLNVDVGPIPVTLDRILWGWLLFSLAVLRKMGRAEAKPLNRVDIAVLMLGVLLIASTFMHDWQYKSKLPLSRLLFFNLMPFGTYFVAKHCRLRLQDLKLIYVGLGVFGLYLAVTAIAEQRGWYALVYPKFILDPQHWEFIGRARGPLLNPVSCGFFLVTSMVATAMMWPRSKPLGKVVVVGIIGLCMLASFLTLTRSVWVACACGVAIIAWLPSRNSIRGTLMVTATLVLLFLVGAFGEKVNRFQRDKDVTEAQMAQSASLRPMLAFVAMKMAKDKPVFGHGFGQYTAAKKPYHYNDTGNMQLAKILPYMQHNVFLSYLTETGLVGLSLLLIILASLTFKSWLLWNSRGLPLPERQLGLVGLAVVSSYAINGMFHDVSIIPHLASLLFLMLGLVENASSSQAVELQRTDSEPQVAGEESFRAAA